MTNHVIPPNEHLLAIHRVRERMNERKHYICLDRNERVTPFPEEIFREILASFKADLFNFYPDPYPLYQRLSQTLDLPEDHLYLTPGSDAAIRMIFQTYLRPDDRVVTLDPTYAMYPIYTAIFRGTSCMVPFSPELSLDIGLIEKALDGNPRVLAIPNPNQPTGTVLPVEVLRHLIELAWDHNTLVIIDEAYYPFYPVTVIKLVREFPNLVVTRTFSKIYGLAGLRLGYFAAQPEVIDHVHRIRGAHEVNAVAVTVGSYVLDHPEISTAVLGEIEAGRQALIEAVQGLDLQTPTCPANFQLVRFPAEIDVLALTAALKERGYLVKDGFDTPSLRNCIRVTLASPDIMWGFAGALKEALALQPSAPTGHISRGQMLSSLKPQPGLGGENCKEQAVWASEDSLSFYQSHRTTSNDLYESERFFMPKVVQEISTCLDVGCAAGGFSRIMKSFNPALRYTGVDIIPAFIEIARRNYPDAQFYVSDGVNLPFDVDSFELVHSSGVLHVNKRWRDMVKACYTVSSRYLLVDFRLTRGPTVVGEIDVDFDGKGPVAKPLPYYVLNIDELLSFLKELRPRPASITARGYVHAPSSTARLPLDSVIMGVFLIEKVPGRDGALEIEIDLAD